MKMTRYRTAQSFRAASLKWVVIWRAASSGTKVLALGALWMFAASCLAIEPPPPVAAAPPHGSPAAGIGHDLRFEFVVVQPKGRELHGFKFQISLDSATQGSESALDLSAGENGLLVTARDVDGVGNDLDLIVRSAKSFTPIGVWINNHHGGFIKADSRIYAKSLWADGPLLLAVGLPETVQRAIVSLPQPCIHPLLELCSHGSRTSGNPNDSLIPARPSHRCADPHTTRGPPARC